MTQQSFLMERDALIDPSGLYRYLLYRRWGQGPSVTWVMLNPSTADALTDDPTVRRCIDFASQWGYAGLEVVNVFAYRSTNPAALKRLADPYGPDHREHFHGALSRGSLIVAAWGSSVPVSLSPAIAGLLKGYKIMCLGRNGDGAPKHPLYVPSATALEEWSS